jgi:tetratricopeptide (TPR) repeat protein
MTAWMLSLWLMQAATYPQVVAQADAAREAGRVEEAIPLYQQAVKLRPSAPEAWWYLGMSLYERDRCGEGESAFRQVTTLDQVNGAAWAMLGLCEFQNRKYDAALRSLVLAKTHGIPRGNEMEKVAAFHLVILLNRDGQHELASSVMMDLAANRAESAGLIPAAGITALRLRYLPAEIPAEWRERVTWAGRAALLGWNKKPAEGQELVQQLIAKHPDLSNAHYLLGYLLLLSNQSDAALAEFREELRVTPGHVQARLQTAYEYLKRGEAAQGLPFAAEAVRLAPGEFMARNILGRIQLELGQVAGATRELEAAVKLAPTSPESHFHLANAYARAGRKADAQRHRDVFARLTKQKERANP